MSSTSWCDLDSRATSAGRPLAGREALIDFVWEVSLSDLEDVSRAELESLRSVVRDYVLDLNADLRVLYVQPETDALPVSEHARQLGRSAAQLQISRRRLRELQWQTFTQIYRRLQVAARPPAGATPALGPYQERRRTEIYDRLAEHVLRVIAEVDEEYDAMLLGTYVRHSTASLGASLVVSGTDSEAQRAAAALGYRLDGSHVVVMFRQSDADPFRSLMATLSKHFPAADMLPAPTKAGGMLLVRRSSRWGVESARVLRRALLVHAERASVGPARRNLEGLRESYRCAQELERARARAGASWQGVLWYSDVRLEMLLLRDIDRAEEFVREELGSLADEDPANVKLRVTVEAWFKTGSNIGTAAMLGVHEHTVRNRLRKAEETIGCPLSERSTELEVALRLRAALEKVPSQGAPR
jgi:hypothetical protein